MWNQHQAFGRFGLNAPKRSGEAEQFRHVGHVDINEALADVNASTVLSLWTEARRYPDERPFGGGVLTDWPAIAVDGFAVCREEEYAIDDYLRHRERQNGVAGGP